MADTPSKISNRRFHLYIIDRRARATSLATLACSWSAFALAPCRALLRPYLEVDKKLEPLTRKHVGRVHAMSQGTQGNLMSGYVVLGARLGSLRVSLISGLISVKQGGWCHGQPRSSRRHQCVPASISPVEGMLERCS